MDTEKQAILNEIYESLHKKMISIRNALRERGYDTSTGYFNFHSLKYKDAYLTTYYPIPEITVSHKVDICIQLDFLIVEATLKAEDATSYNYSSLAGHYNISLYGVNNCLSDFYNKSMELSEIKEKILKSGEKKVHIAFELEEDTPIPVIVSIVDFCIQKLKCISPM